MIVKEIVSKSCMTPSKLTDYVINPYTGCQHGCKYCYAVFMKRFVNVKEDWGDFAHVKMNCPELLIKELESNKPGTIFMSSVTDCYAPIEGKYQLTKKILETINNSPYRNKFKIEILTKSALVKRDFYLIKSLNIELGMSINTLNSEAARFIEPFASPPKLRIHALKEAKAYGIKVYGFISPVIPGITGLEALFKELSFVDYVWIELLNTKPQYIDRLIKVLKEKYPDSIKELDYAIRYPEEYYKKICNQVDYLSKKYDLKIKKIVVHD